jgi:hypothetical protein
LYWALRTCRRLESPFQHSYRESFFSRSFPCDRISATENISQKLSSVEPEAVGRGTFKKVLGNVMTSSLVPLSTRRSFTSTLYVTNWFSVLIISSVGVSLGWTKTQRRNKPAHSKMFWPFWKAISLVSTMLSRRRSYFNLVIVDERSAHQSYDTKGVQTLEYKFDVRRI